VKQDRVTLETIAKKVDVSVTTVHRALYGYGRMRPELREQIRQVAERLGYRPNCLARSLRTSTPFAIGLVASGVENSFWGHMLAGAERAAWENDYNILLAISENQPSREQMLLEALLELPVGGVIVQPAGARGNENSEYYQQLVDEGVHLVVIDDEVPGIGARVVCVDNVLGGRMVGQHLVQLGRKRIGFLTPPDPASGALWVQNRREGIDQALQEAGVEPVAIVGPQEPSLPDWGEFAAAVIRDYWDSGKRLDAVFAANDLLAYGLIHGLHACGVQVPEDVAVVGFDDWDSSAYFTPPLTTVRQPRREIGQEAVQLLLRSVQAEDAPPRSAQRILLEPQLIVRHSCGGQAAEVTDQQGEA